MACEIQSGRLEPCKTVGGLKAVYFGAYDSSTVFGTDANGTVNSISPAATFFKWELRGANTMDEANESSRENGTSFYTATGTFQFKRQDAAARAELEKLSNGNHYVMTEGYDGKFKIYGLDDGCDIAVSTASGSGMGDFNGYNVTVTSLGTIPSRFISSVATGLTISGTTLTI